MYFPVSTNDIRFTKGERYDPKKHASTLRLEGDLDFSNNKKFYSSPFISSPLIERRTLIKPKDNLAVAPLIRYENRTFSPIIFSRQSPTFSDYSDSLSPFNDGVTSQFEHMERFYGDANNLDLGDGNEWESKLPEDHSMPDMSRLDSMRFKDHLYLVGRISPQDEDLQLNSIGDYGRQQQLFPPINQKNITEDLQNNNLGQHRKRDKRSLDYRGCTFNSEQQHYQITSHLKQLHVLFVLNLHVRPHLLFAP